ncbi:MAG TPA: hypothetical protein VGO31_14260 [Microbacteriaceae bacterium]|nr:hypothetical protein [Microbacteriaceae bacterium]
MASPSGLQHTLECACGRAGMCADNRPGHGLNFIQLRIASATRSRWTDAIVHETTDNGWIALAPLASDAARDTADSDTAGTDIIWVWHHADLTNTIRVGDPVALHDLYNVLAAGRGRFNVVTATR